jgi:DNA-binding transcriptional LysR family regulator
MEIEQLQIFIEVVRRKSFAEVAKSRNLDPSIVSRSIAHLEKELDLNLFYRTTRKVEPTEAGLTYYNKVIGVVDELKVAHEMAQSLKEKPSGLFRITSTVSFGLVHMSRLLNEYQKKYPSVQVEYLMTDTVVNLVDERIDLAVRFGHLDDSKFISKSIGKLDYIICGAPKYFEKNEKPEKPEDLKNYNCLQFLIPGFNQGWKFKKYGSQKVIHVNVNGSAKVSNAMGLKALCFQGLGLVMLPRTIVEEELKRGTLIQVLAEFESTATEFGANIWCIYPTRKFMPAKTKAFLDILSRHRF